MTTAIDPALASRQRSVLLETARREVPIAALLFAGIIVAFDVISIASGIDLPVDYLISDVIQGLAFLVVAGLVGRRVTPLAATPWLWSAAIMVSALALNFQYTFDPGGAGIGILVMLMAVFGPITLFWAPYLVGAVIVTIATSYTLLQYQPDYAEPWIITTLTVQGASAALLFARRRSALDVARAAEAMEQAATRDRLTGLLNRHGLMEAAPVLLGLAQRGDRPVFALFVDVGGLKQVNDRFGHDRGDEVLIRTADAVRAASRSGDLVVRWGGDEFCLVGVGDEPQAAELEARIRDALDLAGLEGQWTGTLHIGASASRATSLEDLIAAADRRMYDRRGMHLA